MHDQWIRFDRLFTRQVLNVSTAILQSLSGTTKNADEDCKSAVETSQESLKVFKSRSHCFHFPCSVVPYTHQPGKTFSLTASIVMFSDPLETTASIPHRINLISVNPWVFSYPSLFPRPLPDFISQPLRKIGRRPRSKLRHGLEMVDSVSTN